MNQPHELGTSAVLPMQALDIQMTNNSNNQIDRDLSLSIHDLLALGEYQKALNSTTEKSNEILRLPLFLRLLSSSQHLASTDDDEDTDNDNRYINEIVNLLEKVAASHPSAENIDFTTYLAPEACRSISKSLSVPVKKKRRLLTIETEQDGRAVVLGKGVVVKDESAFTTSGWDNEILKDIGGLSKRKESGVGNGQYEENDDQSLGMTQDDDNDNDDGDELGTSTISSEVQPMEITDTKRKRKGGINLLDRASLEESDSLESTVCKTLLEVLSLVASSLDPVQTSTRAQAGSSTGTNDEEGKQQKRSTTTVSLKLKPDSLLSETSLGASYDSELSSTITTLMHHTPIIRHEHLANALCRAAVPQCADIVKRLAANCPIVSGALVRGCIDACRLAEMGDGVEEDSSRQDQGSKGQVGTSTIIKRARDSVSKIASLSKCEAMQVASTLRQSYIMLDVMFGVMMEHDADGAVCTLRDGLWRYFQSKHESGVDGEGGRIVNSSKRGRARIRKRGSISAAFRPEKQASSLLFDIIRKDEDLASSTRTFLVSQLSSMVSKKNDGGVIWGQATMIVETLGLLIAAIGVGEEIASMGTGSNFVEKSINAILDLSKFAYSEVIGREHSSDISCQDNISDVVSCTSRCDEFVKSALATCITICSKFPSLAVADETESSAVSSCASCFRSFSIWHVSVKSRSFALRIRELIARRNDRPLQNLILAALLNGREDGVSQTHDDSEQLGNFCKWAKGVLPSDNDTSKPVLLDGGVMALVEMGQSSDKTNPNFDSLMTDLLNDADKCDALYEDKGALLLIGTAIARLSNKDSPIIPLILPLAVEMKCCKLLKNKSKMDPKKWRQLVIHLVYAFSFLESQPRSPFAIVPRSLQLREIVEIVCREADTIGDVLLKSIDRFCPELLDQSFDRPPRIQDGMYSRLERQQIKPKDVAYSIQQYLAGDSSIVDGSLERLFLSGRSSYPSIEVDVETASALLTSVEDSYHFMTYSNLCRDPLVLLKCSLKVWLNPGLRRILLSVLDRALMANDMLVKETSTVSSVASECLASRDALVVRCFLFMLSGCYNDNTDTEGRGDGGAIACPIMMSMVRYMVAQHRGLAASIIKQGLPEAALDWLVQYVPETFSDAQDLSIMLESRSLTVVERLQISDGALRIAIVHGSRSNDISQRLVYNTLSVLVSSFYLVIGPVGVPVNVLCDDQGQDITQTCRVALFRMLAALRNIKSERKGLKHEAILALSKIAGLCKSDVAIGGLNGIALQKRKQLLKEVWDAIVKVNAGVAFGGGVQL